MNRRDTEKARHRKYTYINLKARLIDLYIGKRRHKAGSSEWIAIVMEITEVRDDLKVMELDRGM